MGDTNAEKFVLNPQVVDDAINAALNERFNQELKDIQKEVRNQHHRLPNWLVGSGLLILLGLNGFVCYQQWQQSQYMQQQSLQINQQINQLTKQLAR